MSNCGFLKLPRSFYKDPLWLSLSTDHRSIFMTILMNCAWKDTIQDDHGKLTLVKAGECLLTERQIIEEAFPHTNDPKKMAKYKSACHRGIKIFEKCRFSDHKKNQKKLLHTIIREDLLEAFEPNFEPIANQTRTKLEPQNKNIRTKEAKEDVCLSVKENQNQTQEGENLQDLLVMKSRKTQCGVTTAKRSEVIDFLKKHIEHFTEDEIEDSIKTMIHQDPNLNGTIKNYLIGIILKKREKIKNEQYTRTRKPTTYQSKQDPVQRSADTFTASSVRWEPQV